MTIAIQATASTGIRTYSGLIAAITAWLKNSGLESQAPNFIALAEDRFNDVLPDVNREETTTLTTDAETLSLPSDFWEARSVYLDTDPRKELQPVTLAQLRRLYASQTTGEPEVYALAGGDSLILGPSPDSSYSLKLVYVTRIPALTNTNTSNWLLERRSDIYLYASLLQAELYGWNDERLPMIKAALDEALTERIAASNRGRYGAAPLRMRPGVIEVL